VNRLFRSVLIIPLLLLTHQAEAGSGGSIYSFLGIGDLRMSPGVRSAGMGYTGYAIPGPYTINTLSPATWAKIDRARIEGSLLYEGFSSSNGTNSRFLARADVGAAMLALPVSTTKGIVVALGFTPYSKVDYNTYTAGTYIGSADTMAYSINHTGRGGISKGILGASWAPSRSIALGASLNYLFGTVERASTVIPHTSTFMSGDQNEESTMSGTTFTVSAVLDSLGGISPILAPFSFGVSLTTGTNLTTTHRYTYLFTDQRDTTQETEESLKIPAAIGFGIAYRPGDRVLLAADVMTQAWSTSTFKGKTPTGLRNSTMFGIGFERTPARETGQPLLDRLAYRLGAVYHQTYVAPNGDPINAWAVTAGLGIPVSADTRLNLAIEYGSRGTTEKSMIRDNIIRFSASLTISELWFQHFEED
jgi:hypothetical protein